MRRETFEVLVQKRIGKIKDELLRTDPVDVKSVARLQGRAAAFQEFPEIWKEAIQHEESGGA